MDGAERRRRCKSYERVAKGLAYVPQGRMIFSTMTVKENIETGLVVHRRDARCPATSTSCSRCCWR